MTIEARVHVESEFARLRSVVLAQSEFRAPDMPPPPEELAFLPPQVRAEMDQLLGRDFGAAFPERQIAWEAEREALGTMLARNGVEVHRPRLLNPAEKAFVGGQGYANFFARDPFFTVGPVLVEANLRFAHRRIEVLPARDLLIKRAEASQCTYVALPQPALPDETGESAGPFLEGGDVLVLGRQVFVGHSGLASNPAGARWLANLLGPLGYSVELVPLRPDILHLDCALSLVRDRLMVVCEEAFLEGIPQAFADWDRVPVALSDVELLAANGLPISADVYVTDPAFRAVGDQLAARGITVEYVDLAITRSLGGSFRCSTQAFWRED